MLNRSILCQVRVHAAGSAGKTPVAAPSPSRTLKALNLTKSSLTGAQQGSATRNVDGIVYSIKYDADSDKIQIFDRVNRIEYDADVGEKDNRIALVWESGRPMQGPPSFEQIQSILRADAPGAELINGRLAMVSFLGLTGVKIVSGQAFASQLTSVYGLTGAVGLAAFVMAASLAPAFTGKISANKVFPNSNDPYSDRQLPFYFTPLAEVINGRAAMIGIVGTLITEALARKFF
jgi:hypothetical protein